MRAWRGEAVVLRNEATPWRKAAHLGILMTGIVICFPLWVMALLEQKVWGGEGVFNLGSELLSLIPGIPGIYLRRGYYFMTLDGYAWDASLGFGTTVAHRETRIGRGASVGNRCTLGMVSLSEHVTVGSNCDLLSGRRQHVCDSTATPIQLQGNSFKQIQIGRNCWIGNSAIIMADVGANCIIGAGTVVVSAIPAMSVAVGNPAKIVKNRGVKVAGEQDEAFAHDSKSENGCVRGPSSENDGYSRGKVEEALSSINAGARK